MQKILLSGNTFRSALVDDEDYTKLNKYKWRLNSGYAITLDDNNRKVYMHQMLTQYQKIDHADRNKLNYQKQNLRPCNQSLNVANSSLRSDNTTGLKGVHFRKDRNKWLASIMVNGIKYHLGLYDTKEEATKVYNINAREIFGEFAYQNKV